MGRAKRAYEERKAVIASYNFFQVERSGGLDEVGGGGSRRNGMGGSIAEVGRGGRERSVDIEKDAIFRMLSAICEPLCVITLHCALIQLEELAVM